MDTENKSDKGELPLSTQQGMCNCPLSVTRAARKLDISCQQIFEQAYMTAGHHQSLARAIFVFFCTLPKRNSAPATVEKYCKVAMRRTMEIDRAEIPEKGFCLGCMGDERVRTGLTLPFGMAYPEVADAFGVEIDLKGFGWLKEL